MRRVMVRYRVKPDQVAANEQLVRDVYAALDELRPSDFRYMTMRLDDGVTFVHIAAHETGHNPLVELAAFARFQEGIRDRCDEPPVVMDAEAIGSYGFEAVAA